MLRDELDRKLENLLQVTPEQKPGTTGERSFSESIPRNDLDRKLHDLLRISPEEKSSSKKSIANTETELRGPLEELSSAIGSGLASSAEAVGATAEMIGIPGGKTAREFWRSVGESPSLRRPDYLAEGDVISDPSRLADWRWWIRTFGENLPSTALMMLPGIGAGVAARAAGLGVNAIRASSLAGAWSGAATLESGSAYSQAKAEMQHMGMDPETSERIATIEGVSVGVVNGLIELLPFENLFLRQAGADRILKRVVRQAFIEGSTEGVQEAVNIYAEKLGHAPDQKLSDNIARVIESVLAGGMIGGVMGGTVGSMVHRKNVAHYDSIADSLGVKEEIISWKEEGLSDNDIAKNLDNRIKEIKDLSPEIAEVSSEIDTNEMISYVLYGKPKKKPGQSARTMFGSPAVKTAPMTDTTTMGKDIAQEQPRDEIIKAKEDEARRVKGEKILKTAEEETAAEDTKFTLDELISDVTKKQIVSEEEKRARLEAARAAEEEENISKTETEPGERLRLAISNEELSPEQFQHRIVTAERELVEAEKNLSKLSARHPNRKKTETNIKKQRSYIRDLNAKWELWRKSNPDESAAYDNRQFIIENLKPGDLVLQPGIETPLTVKSASQNAVDVNELQKPLNPKTLIPVIETDEERTRRLTEREKEKQKRDIEKAIKDQKRYIEKIKNMSGTSYYETQIDHLNSLEEQLTTLATIDITPPPAQAATQETVNHPAQSPAPTTNKQYSDTPSIMHKEEVFETTETGKLILSEMQNQLESSEGKGITDNNGTVVGYGSSYPPWFREIVKKWNDPNRSPAGKKVGLSAANAITVIKKTLSGDSLTHRQQAIFSDILSAAKQEAATPHYIAAGREIEWSEKGFSKVDPHAKTTADLELQPGDQIIFKDTNSVYTVGKRNETGDFVLNGPDRLTFDEFTDLQHFPVEFIKNIKGAAPWMYGRRRNFKWDDNSTKKEGRFRLAPPRSVDPNYFDADAYVVRGEPSDFISRKKALSIELPHGIRAIVGKVNGEERIQTLRFNKEVWTEKKATNWWEKNKDKFDFFEEVDFEKAKETAQETTEEEGKGKESGKGIAEVQQKEKVAPTPSGEALVASKKEPWKMTKGEWTKNQIGEFEKQLEREKKLLGKNKDSTRTNAIDNLSFAIDALKSGELIKTAGGQFIDYWAGHKSAINIALSEGLPVPKEVLSEYPELQEEVKHSKPKSKEEELKKYLKELTHGENPLEYIKGLEDAIPEASDAWKKQYRKTITQIRNTLDALKKYETETAIEPTPKETKETTTLKEQKKYLINKIEEAINIAPETVEVKTKKIDSERKNEKIDVVDIGKTPTITIEVPGDGEFTIVNSKEELRKFEKMVKSRFPSSDSKPSTSQSSRTTGKRINLEGVEYYNEFKPRKQNVKNQGKDAQGDPIGRYDPKFGTYSNGHFVVKTEKPKGIDVREMNMSKAFPKISDYQDAKIVGEYSFGLGKDSTVNAHVTGNNGFETSINAQYADIILTKYPDATIKTDKEDRTNSVMFVSGDEVVGLVMPIRDDIGRLHETFDDRVSEVTGKKRDIQKVEQIKSIGDSQTIMGTEAIVAKVERVDGVDYELYNANKLKDSRGFVRIYDSESGNVVSINEYPTYDQAEGEFDKAVSSVKGKGAPSSEKKQSSKIEDFGEKIGGARKDYYTEFVDTMKTAQNVDIKAEPLSKSWPEPNYAKLIESGISSKVVSFIRAARDEVPTKPKSSWKLNRWIEQVKLLRDFSQTLLSGKISEEKLTDALDKEEFISVKNVVGARAELYEAVGHEKSLKGLIIASGRYSMYRGVEYNPPKIMWSVEAPRKGTLGNWPRIISSGDTREEAIENFKAKYADFDAKPKSRGVKFDLYSKRGEDGTWIGKKIGKNYIDLEKFDSTKEAREYLKNNQAELEEKLSAYKTIPNERRAVNRERIGKDHRNGNDVTPEMFSDSFGFRGVEFGNWVNNKERQDNLNRAYDALMDLSIILNIPSKAISLNGELGLAFGARGKGGENAPSAHYESINLTRKNGPGTLAHEWWHALDNYFSRRRGKKEQYMTENAEEIEGDITRKEVLDAFQTVNEAIAQTELKIRSRELDKRRAKDYWSTGREMTSRAFENYVIERLAQTDSINDYLANIETSQDYGMDMLLGFLDGKTAQDIYPYLLDNEIEKVGSAFDNLFETIKTKEEKGRTVLYEQEKKPLQSEEIDKLVQRLADTVKGISIAKIKGGNHVLITKNGMVSEIRSVEYIEPDRAVLKIAYGKSSLPKGTMITGSTQQIVDPITNQKTHVIELVRDAAQFRTLGHEYYHFLENINVITKSDILLLQQKIRALHKAGKLGFKPARADVVGSVEDRANWVGRQIAGGYDAKTKTGKIIQKIMDVIGSFFNALRIRTAEDVMRDIKTGEIYGRRVIPGTIAYTKARYEIEDLQTESFSKQLDDLKDGKLHKRGILTVSFTPQVLTAIGAEQLPITMTQGTINKVTKGKHGLPISMLKKLPEQIADPIMVFDSATQPDSLVVMTEMKHDNKTVVAAIHLSKETARYKVNDVASVHPRESETHFINWIKKGLLRYMNKKKSREWSVTSGLQLPTVRGSIPGFKNKILFEYDLVKRKKITNQEGVVFDDEKENRVSDSGVSNVPATARKTAEQGAEIFPRVISDPGGRFVLSRDRILSEAEAVEIAGQSIGRYAQEHILAIIVDDTGKILKIHRTAIGLKSQAAVDIGTIAGLALNTDNAAAVWLVHNHPSGSSQLSRDDLHVSDALDNMLEGTSVKAMPIVAAGSNSYRSSKNDSVTHIIPYYDRVYETTGANLTQVLSSEDVEQYMIRNGFDGGCLLLNGQSEVVGVVSIDNYTKLRGSQQEELLRRIEQTNATGLIAYEPDRSLTTYAGDNLESFAFAAGLRIRDIIDESGSWAAKDLLMKTSSPLFYSVEDIPEDTAKKLKQFINDREESSDPAINVSISRAAESAWANVFGIGAKAGSRAVDMIAGRRLSEAQRSAWDRFTNHWQEFWSPFSTVPEGQKALIARYKAMGDVARAVRFIEDLHKKLDEWNPEVKKEAFQYLDGQIPLNAVTDDALETVELIRQRTKTIGQALVDRGIITEKQFRKYEGRYIHYMYAKHIIGDDGKVGITGTGKLNLTYTIKRNPNLTQQQRKELGLIEDASIAVPVGMGKALTDIAKWDYLAAIAENPEWVWQPSIVKVPVGKIKKDGTRRMHSYTIGTLVDEVATYERMTTEHPSQEVQQRYEILKKALEDAQEATGHVPDGFVQLPTDKHYGPLAGAYVMRPIADDLRPVIALSTDKGRLLNTIVEIEAQSMALFKMGKVALNLPTACRNIISNIIQNNMRGRPLAKIPGDIVAALKAMKAKNNYYDEAFNLGLFKTNWFAAEINDVLDEFKKIEKPGVTWDKVLSTVKNVAKYYGKIDDVSKFSIFLQLRNEGVDTADAALEAMKWGMDYSLTSRSVKGLRQTVLPFLTYQVKIAPLIAESLVKRPWVVGKYLLMWPIMKNIAMAYNDLDDDDWNDLMTQLPAYVKHSGSVAILPWKTEKDQWQWINLEYFFPWGNYLGIFRDVRETDIGEFTRDAGISNPFLDIARIALSARGDEPPEHPYTGRPIWNRLDSPALKAAKFSEALINIWTPSMITRQGAAGFTAKALIGGEDKWGREITVPQALGRWFGVNVVAVSPDQTRAQAAVKIQDLQKEMSRVKADQSYTKEQKEARQKRLHEKLAEIAQESPTSILPVTKAKGKDPVYDALIEMVRSGALHTAPPAKTIQIAGISYPMTMKQYRIYLDYSSKLARPKLVALVQSEAWSKMTDQRKSSAVSAIVSKARKISRQKIKREIMLSEKK